MAFEWIEFDGHAWLHDKSNAYVCRGGDRDDPAYIVFASAVRNHDGTWGATAAAQVEPGRPSPFWASGPHKDEATAKAVAQAESENWVRTRAGSGEKL